MRLKEARAVGAMYYTGKICKKHPEEQGRRRASNGNCHACVVERMRSEHSRRMQTEARHRRKSAKRAEVKSS